ncbi:MAG: DnaJ domain-containing protein [Kofleriaceae bacterium]
MWGKTLASFALQRSSGELVTSSSKQVRIVFEDGIVVAAASPFVADAVVRVALTERLVTSSQVAAIAKRVAAFPGRDEVDLVTEAANLSAGHAARLRRRVITQRAARTFSLDQGTYAMEPVTLAVVPGIAVDICAAIYLGIHQHLSEQRLSEDIRQLGMRFALYDGADTTRFGFTELEQAILESLRRGASLPELDAKHRDITSRTQQAVVYALVACGACEVLEAPAVAAPVAPPSTPRRASVVDLQSRTRTTTWKPAEQPVVPRTITPNRNTFAVRETIATGVAALAANADHYALLGVDRDASPEDLRAAYVGLAGNLHRDKLPALDPDTAANAQRLWAAINVAYGTLSDPARRAHYTHALSAQPQRAPTVEDPITLADRAFHRGLVALKREELDLAIEELAQATELAPRDFDYPAMLAWARFCRASDKQAIAPAVRRALERAVQRSPKPMMAHFYLGRVERILGRVREALYHFHEVLAEEPGHVDAATEVRLLEPRVANRR